MEQHMTLLAAITTARSRFQSSVNTAMFTTKRTRYQNKLTERDRLVVATVRMVLALATVFVFFSNSVGRDWSRATAAAYYGVLVAYLLYGAALSVLAVRRRRIHPLEHWAPWLDAGWYFVLAVL